ncbi:Oidioi.mRNA.OKI2018_I69.chr1.g1949.t1.cds [Oikopleura dioica]|uniref:Oidioi.mRNA.OKI2018_I69.chr1.g1949.t1.cds n=1 Tax=Oikopleura dioica TaxID=34765 RepID=A0ABN7SPJ8_OIKDI|nr:Oidioi.mRNA.OKI2018_I69.chr1.g1949.t1.cds [Oikopleura dioica]
MSENGDVLMSKHENNEESIPVDQRSIKVTISSNLDPIVFEIAGDDNVDFIKQNILAELEKRGRPQKASDLILIKDDEVLDNGAEEIHFLTNGETELKLDLKFPHRLKRQRSSAEMNEIRKRNALTSKTLLRNCILLQKNFNACIESSVKNMDPKDRALIENDGYEDKEEPTGCDLGEMTLELANSMRSWTFQLEKMGKILTTIDSVKDSREAYENEYVRRLIQNNMDAMRFLYPLSEQFTHFVVPLGDEPPRKLSVLPDIVKDSLKND